MIMGVPWDRLRSCIDLDSQKPISSVRIPLTNSESATLKQLIRQQKVVGEGVKLEGKLSDTTKICGVKWGRLKSLAMQND